MKNDENKQLYMTLSPQTSVVEYNNCLIDHTCIKDGKIKTTNKKSQDTQMVHIEDIINVIKNTKNKPDETISKLRKIDMKVYKKKYITIWHGDNVNQVFDKFQNGFSKFEWRHGGFFHVVLKVNYNENIKPVDLDRNVSDKFGKLITAMSRGGKALKVKYYQAIKEFDQLRDGEKYQTPHLHLYIQVSDISQKKVKEKITHYWENLWKVGTVNVTKINTLEHYKNAVFYNTTMKNQKSEKLLQMKLPDEYMDCSAIRRVYYPSSKTTNKLKTLTSFSYYLLFSKELNKACLKSIIEQKRKANELNKVFLNSMLQRKHNANTLYTKSHVGKYISKRTKPKKYRNRKTYRQKLKSNTSTLRIMIPFNSKEIYLETNVPLSTIKAKWMGRYDDNKAFCLTLSEQEFEDLKILDKLYEVKIEEESKQDKLRRSFLS